MDARRKRQHRHDYGKIQTETSDAHRGPDGREGADPAGTTPSVANAADAADVSRRTAYRYFPTQEQLLTEAVLEGRRSAVERVFEPPALAHDVEARLDALVRAIYAELRSTEPLMRMMIRLTVERGHEEDTVTAAPGAPTRPTQPSCGPPDRDEPEKQFGHN